MLKYMHLGYSYIVSFAILQKISEHIIIWLWCQTWSFAFLNKKKFILEFEGNIWIIYDVQSASSNLGEKHEFSNF